MKKNLILLLLLGVICGYAYFGVYKKQAIDPSAPAGVLISQTPIVGINIVKDGGSLHLKLVNDHWRVSQPEDYPADEQFMEKSLQVLTKLPVQQRFALKQDRYGFEKPRAVLDVIFEDGAVQSLVVASQEAPQSHLYVMDRNTQEVMVVHNVWAQLLLYPFERFYKPTLPIPGTQVKSVSLQDSKGGTLWKVEPSGLKTLKVTMGSDKTEISKAKMLWFFKKLREFEITDLQFSATSPEFWSRELVIGTDKGNIRFLCDEKAGKIFNSQDNVFAQYETYSLRSLGYELEKVLKSAEK